MEDYDNRGGAELEVKYIEDDKLDELERCETTTMSDSVTKSGKAQDPRRNDESTGGESENTTVPSATMISPLTVVLIGETSSTEFGSKNLLLDHDEQTNMEQFSSKLYDFFGRYICVINMLGLQNTEKVTLNQGIHAFLLFLSNGLHSSHYNSGVQWLEKTFGRGALSYLITVVTHESGEKCERALKELKTNTGFDENKYHTCTRSMMDEKEIVNLLEKIDIMVSKNDPKSYSGLISVKKKEQKVHLENKSHEEERTELEIWRTEKAKVEEDTNEIKSEPDKEHDEQSQKSQDSTIGGDESETGPLPPSQSTEKGSETPTRQTDRSKEVTSDSSCNTSINEADEPQESTAKTERELGKEHGEQSQENEEGATAEGDSTTGPPLPTPSSEKGSDFSTGQTEGSKEVTSDTRSNMSINKDDGMTNTRPTSQTDSTHTKEGDESQETTTETERELGKEHGEQSQENEEGATAEGDSTTGPPLPTPSSEKGSDFSTGQTEGSKEVTSDTRSNMSINKDDGMTNTRPTSQTDSTHTKEGDESQETTTETERELGKEHGEQSQENEEGATAEGDSTTGPPLPTPSSEKGSDLSTGQTEGSKEVTSDTRSNMSINKDDGMTNTRPTSQTDSTHTKEGDESQETTTETERELGKEHGEQSQENEEGATAEGDSTTGPPLPTPSSEKGSDLSTGQTEGSKEVTSDTRSNMSINKDDGMTNTRPTSQTDSTHTKEGDESQETTTETERELGKEHGEQSQENEEGATAEGDSTTGPPLPTPSSEKGSDFSTGQTEGSKEVTSDTRSNMSINKDDGMTNTRPTSQTDSTHTKEGDESQETTTETESGQINKAIDHSEKSDDSTTAKGQSEINFPESSANEKKEDELKKSTAKTQLKGGLVQSMWSVLVAAFIHLGGLVLTLWSLLVAAWIDLSSPADEPIDVEHSGMSQDITKAQVSKTGSLESAASQIGSSDENTNGEKQSMTIPETVKPYHRETEELLERLYLKDNLQQKLTPANVLLIHWPMKEHNTLSEKDIAHTFLSWLIMLDYRARHIPVTSDSLQMTHSKPVLVSDGTEDGNCDVDVFFKTSLDTHQKKQTHVHPMDVQMAVYHCSDSFLKQIMITKLSQCQYALPLLVPDPVTLEIVCPLWTFRRITKTWKETQITKHNSHTVTMKSYPICKAETVLVSFFRLGSLSVSKSELMNTLINNRHSTFFHRNCPGSTRSCHLMEGVAEIAWYCPAGKPNDAFNDCIAFCNLHGDALSIEKQRDILIEKSFISVFLVPTLEQNTKSGSLVADCFKSKKPLICLIADESCDAVMTKSGKYKMGLKDRNQSEVSEQLKKILREVLSSSDGSNLKQSFQLETMAKVSGIRVDETDSACQTGKSAAMKTVGLFTKDKMDVSEIKDKFLPCQGHLWHQWSKIHKERFHLKGHTKHIEKEKSKKEQELMDIRKKQCDASCSDLMKLFIESLSSLPSTEKEYFLKWTQILIDDLSTDDLSSILQSYDEKWSEILSLKNNRDKSKVFLKQTELETISKKLQSATFGLEHIFREMGQIYEAHRTIQRESRDTDWSKYPKLAAQLMISGYPVELMDGDAGHVPLTWISSLLDEVINQLGDKRIFVLSVLGLQSSGKSTMLNTMFGLQFAVSAGRCTKGAFMQLLKLSEEIKKTFKFDYVLVVDTEGLRAIELEGNTIRHHDNELATFVVGLGNLTLINIFGENPSEMQDILQIVVQAFMRMKKVQLSPSCVFVHQNVTDVAAAEKNMDGKRRLQQKLDEMAKLAAKEEVCNAECFSDVIAFNVQSDVKYCAQLWEGSPPMAPPNPGYSESIQEVKKTIFSKASNSDGITVSQFKTKTEDLWKALLNENFVFSFKNTLEIAVYRKLEVHYGNWTWALRNSMLNTENQLHNRIENGKLDKVEMSYLNEETSKTYEEIKKEMTTYFEDDREKEMLAQWKARFEIKIKEFHDDQLSRVKRKLDEVIQQKNARKELDNKKTEFENKLLQKSKVLAQKLKDKAKDEEELKKQFSSVWKCWVTELTANITPVEDINLEEDQFNILQEIGIEWALINESKRSGKHKEMSEIGDYSGYVILPKNQTVSKSSGQGRSLFKTVFFAFVSTQQKHNSLSALSHEEQQQIRSLISRAEKESLDAIKSKPVDSRGYTPKYLLDVARHVKEVVAKFDSEWNFFFKKEFTVDLLLYVFYRAESWLLDSQKKFKMNNDPLTYLESKKEQYYTIFRSYCKGHSSVVVLGELICEKLKASTVEAVYNKTAIGLADQMRCNFPAFSGNRLNLEKHLLKSLAENEDFHGFNTYISDPKRQTEAFIKAEVQKYILEDPNNKAVSILKKNVDDINTLVLQGLFTATQKAETQKICIDMWLNEFFSLLKDELTVDTICSQNFSDIEDFEFLKEEIKRGFRSIKKEMSIFSPKKMNESRKKPDDILIEQLCKCCWVKCPFCSAVCTNTIEEHSPDDHNVPFHRSSGISGCHYKDTVELCVDFCTTLVASDYRFYSHHLEKWIPFKEYRTGGPRYAEWRITSDESKLAYWKWFVCQFQTELEKHYNFKFQGRGEIPSEWKKIKVSEAIKSLDEMYA